MKSLTFCLAALAVSAAFAGDAHGGWRLIEIRTRYERDTASDSSMLPPAGGTASAELEGSGKILRGEAHAYDWTLWASMRAEVSAHGFYLERWRWRRELGSDEEPFAEFKLVARLDVKPNAKEADCTIGGSAMLEMKVRCGDLFLARATTRFNRTTGTGGFFVGSSFSGLSASTNPSGFGGGGGIDNSSPTEYATDNGDICNVDTYLQTHTTKGSLRARADGGLGGPAECFGSLDGEAKMEYRVLGSIENCATGG